MDKEWQRKYTLRYLKQLHYKHKWARWLTKDEIIKWCKKRGYDENIQNVILSLDKRYLIDEDPRYKS